MNGQPDMRHTRTFGEPALHHEPAKEPLQATECEQEERLPGHGAIQLTGDQEPDERQQKHHTDQPADQAVNELPPEDRLEILQFEMRIDHLVLGNLFVLLKSFLPLLAVHRRYSAHDRSPFRDG